ncbi:hypothetical protein PISMIDRAFT_30405 [Pisolithus microcarpus 441]|uniref:Adenylosuccinate synthetase n=1 Tax=Pisolithus microcarpus 441 TaxID=765257 RepID=A0A0C9Y2P7_9AGAM|nr:hypothetical protein PISMIDRAFT_30405 [Pisolithus microcarpus 441]
MPNEAQTMMRQNGAPNSSGYFFTVRASLDGLIGFDWNVGIESPSVVGPITVVLGSQWGDEGKGKLVDILSADFDVCARCAGGNNAGHTIVAPVGPQNCGGRIFVSDRAHLVFDFHQIVDGLKEVELGGSSIGTTKKGIGPAYSSKASRSGLRVHHLFDQDTFAEKFRKLVEGRFKRYGHFEYDTEAEIERYKHLAERLKPYVVDSVSYIHGALASKKKVLVEGANALMLDIDFGTYPYVTSSSTDIGGVCTGLGIPPRAIGRTIGVIKAYTTRVGGGPFPTEQLNDVGVHLQEAGKEYGTTTGRRRRCGWLDLVVMKYSCLINGYDSLNLTKLDVLDNLSEIKVAVKYAVDGKDLTYFPADLDLLSRVEVVYETLPGWKTCIESATSFDELPESCKNYVAFIEAFLDTPIEWVGVGPGRENMLKRQGKVLAN